ncbi:hypothetical protein K3495_g14547, partial [Podosphaera aphanis]
MQHPSRFLKQLDAIAIKEITEQEVIQALEWPSLAEDSAAPKVVEEIFDDANIVIPTNPNAPRSKEDKKSEQENQNNDFHLPGFFPEEVKTSSSLPTLIKGYTYIDESQAQTPSNTAMEGNRELARAQGNSARNAALINLDIDQRNIISRRTRNSNNSAQFADYHCSFSSAIMKTKNWTKLTRDELPPAPKGWEQMLRHQFSAEFQKAAEKEYEILEEKHTWTYVAMDEVPKSCKIIPVIWIFTYKFDSDGYLVKFKARLCARGDLLESEDDPYAATLACQSFRAMMAITAAYDLEIRQYDVINAFVNAPIRGEVYCHSPKGFEKEISGRRAALKLMKALYGFKFSPLYWYDEFLSFLLDHGFYQVPGVNCMVANQYITLIFYVDDIMITFNHSESIQADEFERNLSKTFEVRQVTNTCSFLGIRIVRERPARKLWLCQDSYIESLAKTFNILNFKTPKTPIPQNVLLPYQ